MTKHAADMLDTAEGMCISIHLFQMSGNKVACTHRQDLRLCVHIIIKQNDALVHVMT